jgi:pyruvate dehydrogenase E2 component (dihydrolipoamide acetyltransferase)
VATEVKLPRLGQGMESGTIVRWLKGEGDPVRKNEPLYELDTDKVTQEVEAETDGVLLRILVLDGEVGVGTTVAVIGAEGEDPSATDAPAPVAPEPASSAVAAPTEAAPEAVPAPEGAAASTSGAAPETAASPEAAASPTSSPANGRVKASPLARRIARERGVDLTAVAGTGPDGRVVAKDVETAATSGGSTAAPGAAAASRSAPPAQVEIIPLTSTRKTIARRLTEAWTAPVFQLGASVDATEMLALREDLVRGLPEGAPKPTVNDLLVKFAAVSLIRHPAVNAQFTGEEIHRYPNANIGIAVAAPNGLVVPVISGADRLSIHEIAGVRSDLVSRARDGKLTLADMAEGTFTISNLGMFGVEQFTAVLNPPQVAILAVGAVKDEAVVVDGEFDIAPLLRLSLTCDHRAIDGADGAQFLQTLVALIEHPALAL